MILIVVEKILLSVVCISDTDIIVPLHFVLHPETQEEEDKSQGKADKSTTGFFRRRRPAIKT